MNWNQIHKYLADECSREEHHQFERWLEADEQNQQFYQSIKRIWEVSPQPVLTADQLKYLIKDDDEAWEQFKASNISSAHLNTGSANPDKYNSIRQRKKILQRPVLYTAAAIILLVTAIFIFKPYMDEPATQMAQQEYEAGPGEHISLQLNDSTRVTLNENSKLVVNKDFSRKNREVFLTGEAFFEVTRDKRHPFTVNMEKACVKVLGTEFNINSNNESEAIQVAVLKGKVSLESADVNKQSGIILTKNKLGLYDPLSGEFKIENTNATNFINWMTGRLVFKNNSLLKVSRQLEHLYDIKIEFANSKLKQRRLSANLEKQDLKAVLNIIAKTLDVDYSMENGLVTWQR